MKPTTKEQLVAELRQTQKLSMEACDDCGSVAWECKRVTSESPWPWPRRTDQLSQWQKATWPWVGGITVTCVDCKRTWFGNASMQRFDEVRDQLPMDGTAKVVRFERAGKKVQDGLVAREVRRFARPRRRAG